MATSTVVNSIGLVFDIAGVVMVWRYGLPQTLSREGVQYIITEQTDEAEKAKAARFDLLSRIGLILIIGGFALQLLSNFLKG
jgi:hypothetical protein